MIGNAVPVELGRYVAECINQYRTDEAAGEVKKALRAGSPQLSLFQEPKRRYRQPAP